MWIRNDLDKTDQETILLKLGTKFLCSTLASMKTQKDFHVHFCCWGPRWFTGTSYLKPISLSHFLYGFCCILDVLSLSWERKKEITFFGLIAILEWIFQMWWICSGFSALMLLLSSPAANRANKNLCRKESLPVLWRLFSISNGNALSSSEGRPHLSHK